MRIAFFTDDYLPNVSGLVRSVQAYREALEAQGHEVFIVAPSQGDDDDHDAHVIRIPAFTSGLADGRAAALVYPGITRRFDDYEFDIIHTQTQFWVGIIGYYVAKRQGRPHITTMHTMFPELLSAYPAQVLAAVVLMALIYPFAFAAPPILPVDRSSLERLRASNKEHFDHLVWKVMNIFMNHTSLTIAPSQAVADTLVQHGLTAPVGVLPTGIDTALYAHPARPVSAVKRRGDRWIVAVGRLSAEKRQAVLIDALAQVADPHVKLVLVGEGAAAQDVRAQAARLGLAGRVIFTGVQPRAEVAALLAAGDLFALASYRFDTQAMVVLEAAAAGLPVVYCDDHLSVGLTPDNALLTAAPDAAAFAAAWQALLADPRRRAAMGQAARRIAAGFDMSRQATLLEDFYRQTIQRQA